jgi:hypothetical protein
MEDKVTKPLPLFPTYLPTQHSPFALNPPLDSNLNLEYPQKQEATL